MSFGNCVRNFVLEHVWVRIETSLMPFCDDLAKRWRIASEDIDAVEEGKEGACNFAVTMTTTKTTTRVKSEYLAWARGKRSLLRELSVSLIESTETHLQLSVKGTKLQILIPSRYELLTTAVSSTTPPPPDSDEVFLVVTAGAVNSRLDSSMLALNEKLERIVVAQEALHEVLDLLLAVVTSLGQSKRNDENEELQYVKHANSHDVNANCDDEENRSNKDWESNDDIGGSEFMASEGEDDDDDYNNLHNYDDDADYTASGYDIAMGESAIANSNAEVESRAHGFLHALAETARKACEEAQTAFREPDDREPEAREPEEVKHLMWCRVISNPTSLKIQLQFELAGILGDHIAAGLNLSLDDPVTLHLSFDRAVWCESIFRPQKPIDCEQIQATQPHRADVNAIASTQAASLTETEPDDIDVFLDKEAEIARGREHRSYGLEILFPELTVRFFEALNSSRESTITSSSRRRKESLSSSSSSSSLQLDTLNYYIQEPNPILGLAKFISHQLRLLPNRCLVCWQPLPSCVTRMRTCDRDLCLYRFEELGLGAAVLQEVKISPELVDLELSLANAAIHAPRDVFEPFPAFLLTKDGVRGRSGWFSSATAGQHRDRATSMTNQENKNTQLLQAVLLSIPSIETLKPCATEKDLKRVLMRAWYVYSYLGGVGAPHGNPIQPLQPARALPHQNPGNGNSQHVWRPKLQSVDEWRKQRGLAYDVMRFVLTSNRLSLRLLAPEEEVVKYNTISQFVMLHDSPEREAHFTQRREQAGGSFFAFHGSAAENWYSILRNGLRSMSNTLYMSTGAAYGEGIYFGGNISTSFQYAKATTLLWDKGCLREGFQVVAICEIVNGCTRHNAADHSSRNIIVVPKEYERDVAIRYLLVFRESHNSFLIRGDHSIEGCILGNKLNLLDHYQQLRGNYEKSQQEQKQSRMSVRYEILRAIAEENRRNEKTMTTIPPPTLKRKAELREEQPLYPQPQQQKGGKRIEGEGFSMRAVMKEFNAITKAIEKSPPLLTFIQSSENAAVLSGVIVDIDESDISTWRVSLHPYLFKQSPPLYKDLTDLKRMRNAQDDVHVILEVKFPASYPFEPPFVRVLSPRFIMHSGHVTIGGSICMELLTASGWSPACSFESLLVQVVMAFVEGQGRIDIKNSMHGREYQEHEAREAFLRAARTHGWQT